MSKAFLLLILTYPLFCGAQEGEPYLSNKTYTYEQTIEAYTKMAREHPGLCTLQSHGFSDDGAEMSLFIINKSGKFESADFNDKVVLMINNGIHPGEPCGVDACVKLSKDLLADPKLIPDNVVIGIIPLYNIGGAKNRNCCSRTNQNGPEMYGFRGNSKNLDLNRDFIKADSKNTKAFYAIYHYLHPHIFVDTHTSNGADYQHIMTLITSQTDKMTPELRNYTLEKLNPYLFDAMAKDGYDMVPYVHTVKQIPDDGIMDYLESPRYSTGYTNLFNTISFVTETHMLKTFRQRVESTYTFLELLINYMDKHYKELIELKQKADYQTAFMKEFPIEWVMDTVNVDSLFFKGYEAEYIPSEVTNAKRLYYNRDRPFERYIPYYNHFTPSKVVQRPDYYLIPGAWDNVIDNLKANHIKVYELTRDLELSVEVYYIADYETVGSPYEGHYLHHHVQPVKDTIVITYKKGDYIIPTQTVDSRFIVETLEPHATDSYLAWNYFDATLQQKEWFSAYVFEDEASTILDKNPGLKKRFEEMKKDDPEFAKNDFAQLYFIYKNSEHYEPTHKRYPITRFNGKIEASNLRESK